MQHDAIDLALDDAGIDQAEKRLEQHFADAVEALFERSGLQRRVTAAAGASRFTIAAKLRVVAMAKDQPLRQRVADLADADLQRAAVAHQAGGVKPDGVFGVGDRLGRRREQRKFGAGTSSTALNSSAGRSPAPGMNGNSELTWPTSLNDARPSARARNRSSVVSVLQLRL